MIDFRYGKPLSNPDLIPEFERKYGITLPEGYTKIALSNDGSIVGNANCSYTNPLDGTTEMVGWNGMIPFEGEEDYLTMDQANSEQADEIPQGIILFGKEGGGYLFGFDYRRDETFAHPSVVIVNLGNPPDLIVTEIAPSFDQFVHSLVPDSDEPAP